MVEKILKSHQLHLQWKIKLWEGKFPWSVKAKHCWVLSPNIWKQKVCWHHPAMFALLPQINFSTNNLHFHWRWRDRIMTLFLNLFYFNKSEHTWKTALVDCLRGSKSTWCLVASSLSWAFLLAIKDLTIPDSLLCEGLELEGKRVFTKGLSSISSRIPASLSSSIEGL